MTHWHTPGWKAYLAKAGETSGYRSPNSELAAILLKKLFSRCLGKFKTRGLSERIFAQKQMHALFFWGTYLPFSKSGQQIIFLHYAGGKSSIKWTSPPHTYRPVSLFLPYLHWPTALFKHTYTHACDHTHSFIHTHKHWPNLRLLLPKLHTYHPSIHAKEFLHKSKCMRCFLGVLSTFLQSRPTDNLPANSLIFLHYDGGKPSIKWASSPHTYRPVSVFLLINCFV